MYKYNYIGKPGRYRALSLKEKDEPVKPAPLGRQPETRPGDSPRPEGRQPEAPPVLPFSPLLDPPA